VADILLVPAAVMIPVTAAHLFPQIAACCCRMIHKISNRQVRSYRNLNKTYVHPPLLPSRLEWHNTF
jgi:hypothetical protein